MYTGAEEPKGTPEKETLAEIIARLNDLFAGESLRDKDRLYYLNTVKDKKSRPHGHLKIERSSDLSPGSVILSSRMPSLRKHA